MSLTAGIVGLPNVGKSTLFNAITKAGAEMANYPFATIEPNVGMVEVPDKRLARIQELIPAKKIVHTTFEFTDIAGLVKGASKGEGLGNKFLENIRQTDAIVHVVRAFDDDNITSVTGKVDPEEDINTINLELAIADLDAVNRRINKVKKVAQQGDKEAKAEMAVLNKLQPVLEEGNAARSIDFNEDEQKIQWLIQKATSITKSLRSTLKAKVLNAWVFLLQLKKKSLAWLTMKRRNSLKWKALKNLVWTV